MREIFERHFVRMALQMIDSAVPTTRAFWRRKYFNATDAEAADPRPFAEVIAGRKSQSEAAAP